MGKTRLALAVAKRHLSDSSFAHGVYFVALAPLTDSQHLGPALAEALSFALQADGEARQQVLDYLRAKQMLLIFDNFEHMCQYYRAQLSGIRTNTWRKYSAASGFR